MKPTVFGLLLLLSLPGAALAADDRAAMVRQEQELLVFDGGGTPLSPTEAATAAALVDRALSANPTLWRERSGKAGQVWAGLQHADLRTRWRNRAATRLNVQAANLANDPLAFLVEGETAIIQAHDPAVVWDAPARQLVTHVTVERLVEAERAASPMLGLPAPPENAQALLEHAIRSEWPTMDALGRGWLANAETNLPLAIPYLNRAQGDQRTRSFEYFRSRVLPVPTEEGRLLKEALLLAGAGANGASAPAGSGSGSAGGTMAGMMMRQNMMNNAMMGASRSYSPSCNVYTGTAQANPSFCAPH